MRLIEKEEAAKRLARVILSDIELYNAKKVKSRADLKPELDEGYKLFRSRVAPELVPIFSEVVADRLGRDAPPPAAARPPAAAPRLSPPRLPAVAPPPPPRAVAPPPQAPAPPPPARRDHLEPREAARRLARVMVSSIECDRDDGGDGLAAEIAEARTLYLSCVLPELAPLFEEALAQRGLRDEESHPLQVAPEPPEPPEPSAVDTPLPGDATDRVVMSEVMAREPTPAAFEELPTIALPPAPAWPSAAPALRSAAPALPFAPPPLAARAWSPSNWRLAALAGAIALASAGIVYYLLTGP